MTRFAKKFGFMSLAVAVLTALGVLTSYPALADMSAAFPHSHPHAAETHGLVVAAYYGLALLASTGVFFAVKAWARNR